MYDLIFHSSLFLLGLLLGSFAGLCAYRLPRGENVIRGKSHCDYCQAPLNWCQKFPLLGYLILHGRSHCCRRRISWRYPVLEVSMGLGIWFLARQLPADGTLVTAILFCGFLTTGMLIDLDHKIIPDKVTLTGIAAGLLLAGIIPTGDLLDAILGVFICGGFLYLSGWLGEHLFKKKQAMGGGDIKFAAMMGAFLGWQLGLLAILLAAFAGAAFGVSKQALGRRESVSTELPFGPFLATAAVSALLWGHPIIKWYSINFLGMEL